MTTLTIADMRDALTSHPALSHAGKVTEYLPHLAFLAFTFDEGLSVRIADHGNGAFQATLDGFYTLEPAPLDALVKYLATV